MNHIKMSVLTTLKNRWKIAISHVGSFIVLSRKPAICGPHIVVGMAKIMQPIMLKHR